MSKITLTNVRTFLQFSQYGNIIQIEFYGNKLMALNSIKSSYGVKSFSVLNEYKTDGFLPQGYHTVINS